MALVAFVRFRDSKGKELPDIMSLYDNGLIRDTLPVEWTQLREPGMAHDDVPVIWETASELARYASYDAALRRG